MRYAASGLVEICGESMKPPETESSRTQQSQGGNGRGRDRPGSKYTRKQTRSSPRSEINQRGWLDNLPIDPKNATVDFESHGHSGRAGIGGVGMPGRIPHGYRPMDWFLPPFFLPPLIGHAQKQILTSYSTAERTCAAQHFGFSQPGGKRTAARRTHALWSVGSQDASVRSADERRPDLIALFVFGTLPNMPPNGGANVSPSVLPRKRPLQTLD